MAKSTGGDKDEMGGSTPSANGKFLGETKGNRDLRPCLSEGSGGGSGESHAGAPSGKFLGSTKGNTDLKIDRTSGVQADEGGKYIAGRGGKPFSGNTAGKP